MPVLDVACLVGPSTLIAPPAWIAPKRRGRPRSQPVPDPAAPKRPRGSPRKIAMGTSTS